MKRSIYEGKRRGGDGASIQLLTRGDGQHTMAHVAGRRRWRLGHREVEDDWGDGPNGPVRLNGPAWQLGWQRVSRQIQGFEHMGFRFYFRIDFKDFEFKIKGFKYFKLDSELRSN
jgi:hypothetical protein